MAVQGMSKGADGSLLDAFRRAKSVAEITALLQNPISLLVNYH